MAFKVGSTTVVTDAAGIPWAQVSTGGGIATAAVMSYNGGGGYTYICALSFSSGTVTFTYN